ncbi:hypothetical protein [Roseimaritima sediminicola]|uniref:hypothetical protein n=1 Tax=Roseimaritima sediminicola TaxID=2662066 RepID=UPI0012985154|nr:hypothetical protein [Roseimaritima sediminicola]
MNVCSKRFLSRSLATAFAVVCGVSLSSVAQAQMPVGSGCTNCGGSSAPATTYSQPATTYTSPATTYTSPATTYSQPASYSSRPAGTVVRYAQPCGSSTGCGSARRSYSSARPTVGHFRHGGNRCGTAYRQAPVYSQATSYSQPVQTVGGCGAGGCSGAVQPASAIRHYPAGGTYQVARPVMQTGAGCGSGNCR